MKGVLPSWLEAWLGIEAAESGEGTSWELAYLWTWGVWATIVALVVIVATIVYCYSTEGGATSRRIRGVLIALRLSAVAVLALMVAQIVLALHRTGLPSLAIVIDDSASMQIVDRYEQAELKKAVEARAKSLGAEQATRLDLAKGVLLDDRARFLREAAEQYNLRLYSLSDRLRSQRGDAQELSAQVDKLNPEGASTRLGTGLRQVLDELRGSPPTAIVLLSDGIATEGESLAEAARYSRSKGVPLFAVGIGSEAPHRDIEVSDLLVDEVVFVDDVVSFDFKLTASGYEGRQINVVLRDREAGAPLAEQVVAVAADAAPQRVRLPYRPTEVGEFEYTIEVVPLDDEVQTDNNRQERIVSVRKEKIRVLLVQAYPSYEFRYLKHLFERDDTVELDCLLQEADLGYADTDSTALRSLPVRRDDLFAYDVVIFGDVEPSLLGQTFLADLGEFVTEKGGGLIVIAGERHTPQAYLGTPLAALLPVEVSAASSSEGGDAESADSGFQVRPTDLGLLSPTMQLGDTPEQSGQIWAELPPLFWLTEGVQLKPAARVMAEHPARSAGDGRPMPIIAHQYVGAGKVVFHASDETWRWRYRVGDTYFARYWVQTIRYLSRAKLLGQDRAAELSADRREYRVGEPVRLRARFYDDRVAPTSDDGVSIVVGKQNGEERRVVLGRSSADRGVFEGEFTAAGTGPYHAWMATPTLDGGAPAVDFLVVAPPGEFERVQMDAAELRQAVRETKGRFFTLETVGDLQSQLPRGRQVPIQALPPLVLWDKWPVLCLLLSLLVGEWVLRKRVGML